MGRMARALARAGYQVHNLGYPSRRFPIEGLAAFVGQQIEGIHQKSSAPTHFVTHSLGGIVLRCYLKTAQPAGVGRVVMLAPPNQGAVLADIFSGWPLFHWIIGPVGAQIGTGPESLPNTLGPVDAEVGVIAGNRSLNPLFSPLIPGPDDGRIAVERTQLAGMKDFLVLPCIHPLIMNYGQVIRQTIHFLARGRFQR
jgi:hypothetical protein